MGRTAEHRRLLEPIENIQPADVEAAFGANLNRFALVICHEKGGLRQTGGRFRLNRREGFAKTLL